jgi:1,4-dihydroxy-2-naphthoate octaprenyltransferase
LDHAGADAARGRRGVGRGDRPGAASGGDRWLADRSDRSAGDRGGLAYGGPLPFGYLGLGELGVFVFFGVVAVCGTYFVQAGGVPFVVFAASLAVGALASAILVVNNLRDVDTDRAAGKRTLAVRFGRRVARVEYAALIAFAYGIPIALVLSGGSSATALAPLVSLPWAALIVVDVIVRAGTR